MFGSKETSPTFSGRIWISYFGCSFILSLSRICSLVPVGSIELCISISVIPECAEAFCSKSLPLLQVVVDVIFAEIFLFFFFQWVWNFLFKNTQCQVPKVPFVSQTPPALGYLLYSNHSCGQLKLYKHRQKKAIYLKLGIICYFQIF